MELSLDGFAGKIGNDVPIWWPRRYDDELRTYAADLLSSAWVHAMGQKSQEGTAPH